MGARWCGPVRRVGGQVDPLEDAVQRVLGRIGGLQYMVGLDLPAEVKPSVTGGGFAVQGPADQRPPGPVAAAPQMED